MKQAHFAKSIKRLLPPIIATFAQFLLLSWALLMTWSAEREYAGLDIWLTFPATVGAIGIVLTMIATWKDRFGPFRWWLCLSGPLFCNLWAAVIPWRYGAQYVDAISQNLKFGFPVTWQFYGLASRIVDAQCLSLIWSSAGFVSFALMSQSVSRTRLLDLKKHSFLKNRLTWAAIVFTVLLFTIIVYANRPFDVGHPDYLPHWLKSIFFPLVRYNTASMGTWRLLLAATFFFAPLFGYLFARQTDNSQTKTHLLPAAASALAVVGMLGTFVTLFDSGRTFLTSMVLNSGIDLGTPVHRILFLSERPWFAHAAIVPVAVTVGAGIIAAMAFLHFRNKNERSVYRWPVIIGAAIIFTPIIGREAFGIWAIQASATSSGAPSIMSDIGRFTARVPASFESAPGTAIFFLDAHTILPPITSHTLRELRLDQPPVFISIAQDIVYVNQTRVTDIDRLSPDLEKAHLAVLQATKRASPNLPYYLFSTLSGGHTELKGKVSYSPRGTAFVIASPDTKGERLKQIFTACINNRLQVKLLALTTNDHFPKWRTQQSSRPLLFVDAAAAQQNEVLRYKLTPGGLFIGNSDSPQSSETLADHLGQSSKREGEARLLSIDGNTRYDQILETVLALGAADITKDGSPAVDEVYMEVTLTD